MNIVLFGPPGSGKGTQSAFLVSKLKMHHISTGDLFREAIRNKTPLGMQVKEIMDQGGLVPDEVTIKFFEETFSRLERSDGFVFDGFPRTINQAKALKSFLVERNLKLGKAVFLEVPNDLLVRRLTGRRSCKSCGAIFHIDFSPAKLDNVCDICGGELLQRVDDQPEAVKVRLEKYDSSTKPLKDFYRNEGLFLEIDGSKSQEEVFLSLSKIVLNRS